jgi:histidine decarboxylase
MTNSGNQERFSGYFSDYNHLCQGARHASRYLIAFNVSAAKTKRLLGNPGSSDLDEVNAFDLAEVQRMNLGQLNLIRVSSFCGPEGLIWGYDIKPNPGLREHGLTELTDVQGGLVPVYSATPLMDSATDLFGTIERKRFPIAPGSLCPAAWKSLRLDSPGTAYASLAFGIAADRTNNACCLMEDVGTVPETDAAAGDDWRKRILEMTSRSVLSIFANQRARCKEIFVAMSSVSVGEGEVGCALLLAPYFSVARNAVSGQELAEAAQAVQRQRSATGHKT